MRLVVLFAALATSVLASTVTCVNNASTDTSNIQTAATAGGTVTLVGTCNVGATTITFGSNVNFQGSGSNGNVTGHGATTTTVVNYSGTGFMFRSSGSNNTINGMTLSGGGIFLNKNDTVGNTGQGGWNITNNTIQNTTSEAFRVDHIIGRDTPNNHNSISNNQFTNINNWGIFWGSGIDNTLIDNNFFTGITLNPIKGFDDWFSGNTNPYTATNIQISNNDMQQYHRIGIENQGNTGGCPGGCNNARIWATGTVISGNFSHNYPANADRNVWAYSLFFAASTQVINNTAVNSKTITGGILGIGYEWAGFNNSIFQGNVTRAQSPYVEVVTTGFTSITGTGGATACTAATGPFPCTVRYQNNIWVNNPLPTSDTYGINEGGNQTYCFGGSVGHAVSCDQPTYIYGADFMNGSGAAVSEASNISFAQFTSADNQSFPTGGNGTWRFAVVSNLSIRQVQFFLDGSSTPTSTQQISDVNTNFTSDQRWNYSSTINTSTLSAGSHTIRAKTTDVSGTTVTSAAQTFSVGGVVGTTCTNNAGTDPAVLQGLINGGGTVNLSGQTCNLGSLVVNIGNAVVVNGPATIIAAPTQTTWGMTASVGGFTLHNLTFTNAGLHVTGAVTSTLNAITLTGNTWQNFNSVTSGSPMTSAVQIDPILTNGVVRSNTFSNIWTNGFPSTSVSADTNTINAMFFNGGMSTNTVYESNTCLQVSGNCLRSYVGGSTTGSSAINNAAGVSISYNKMNYVHGSGLYTAGGPNTVWASPKIAGNILYHPAFSGWGGSGMNFATNVTTPLIVNNAVIMDVIGNTTTPATPTSNALYLPPGLDSGETPPWFPGGGTFRGNLIAGDPSAFTPPGFGVGITTFRANSATSIDNNLLCGPANNTTISATAGFTDQFNFKNATCPAGTGTALWSSNIVPTFTSANNQNFPFFGPATWSINVVSNLPIRSVAFAVDGAAPVVTQEIQDQSATFASDRAWKYHATFDTTGLSAGAHTIVATITDVNGGTQTPSQSFTAGNPAIKYTPIDVRVLPGQSITINFAVAPGGTWTVPAGSNAIITGQTATTVTVQAPATPIYALHQEHGCPVTPNDSILATPASAFPTNTNNAAWMSTLGPENVFPTATWESNVVTNATPDQTNTKWFYTSAANGQTWKWPDLKSRYREGGAIAQTAIGDHHLVLVNTDDCTWYETYNDHKTDIQTGACDHNLNIGTGCDAQSNYKYSGYTDLAAPVGTPDTNGTGTTQASDMPYEPMIIQLGELEHGTIHHPLAFTPSIGFVQASFSSSCPNCILWPAGSTTGGVATNTAPPMGARAILKSSYTPSGACNAMCANLITALKTYGAVVADLAGVFPINVGDSVYSSAAGSTGMNQFLNLLIFMTPTNWTWLDESSALMDGTANAYTTYSPYYSTKPNNGFVTPANSLAIFNAAYGYVPIAEIPASVGYAENFAWYTDAQAYTPKVITNGNAGSVSYSIPVCSSGIGTCGTYDTAGLYTPPVLTCGTTKTLELQASIGSGSASDWQYVNLVHVPSLGCPLGFDNGNSTSPFTAGDGTIYLPDGAVRFQQALSLSTFPGDSNFSQSYNGSANANATLYQTAVYSNFDAYIGPMYGLPHTNYLVTQFFGVGGGNNGGSCDSRAGWWNTSYNGGSPFSQPSFIDLNGLIVAPQYDRIGWESRQECYQPISFTGPMTVASDPAYIANHATEQGPGGFSAVKIVQDSGTSPHIQIIIPDGFNRLTPVEQIAPAGTILLYDFPWFLPGYQQTASVWSIVSGPGSITPAASCTPVLCYATFTAPSVQTISTPTVVKVQNGANSQTYTLWTIGTQSPL